MDGTQNDNNFRFILPLQKEVGDRLSGVASTTSVDRDDERMDNDALKQMADEIRRQGVNLFGNHEHGWENILGGIDNADVVGKQLNIGINLNKANPKYGQLVGTLDTKGVRVGLSVGGNVNHFRWEYDKGLGKKIKVLDDVKIYEVSVVGIPSNADSYLNIPQAIAKSAKLTREKTCGLCFYKTEKERCPVCLTNLEQV